MLYLKTSYSKSWKYGNIMFQQYNISIVARLTQRPSPKCQFYVKSCVDPYLGQFASDYVIEASESLKMLRLFRQACRPTVAPLRCISSTQHLRADPWPLPNTPEHLASSTSPPDTPAPTPLPRPNETLETLRARLVYQSRKRGTLESDLLLSTFARDQLPVMNEGELKEYDRVGFLSISTWFLGGYLNIVLLCTSSCWMSRTGIYTTGAQGRKPHPNDGRIRLSLTNLESTRVMKAR